MSHGAHSAQDVTLLLGIFVIFVVFIVAGFFLIWKPLRQQDQQPVEMVEDEGDPQPQA